MMRVLLVLFGAWSLGGCAVETVRTRSSSSCAEEGAASRCACSEREEWPIQVTRPLGDLPPDEDEPWIPLDVPCEPGSGASQCPPGTFCSASSGLCRIDRVRESTDIEPARFGVRSFSLAVEEGPGGARISFERLPSEAVFVRCAFYGCAVDGASIEVPPERCLLETVEHDLSASPTMPIPGDPVGGSGSSPVELDVCRAPEALGCESFSMPFIPTAFKAVCTAYSRIEMVAISEIATLRPAHAAGLAGGSYVERCTRELDGRACLLDRGSDEQIGVCAVGACSPSCMLSTDCSNSVCAPLGWQAAQDSGRCWGSYLGFCDEDVLIDGSGREVCRDPTLVPDGGRCVTRLSDRDGDGYTDDVDCDDNDPDRHPGAREIPGDGRDQNCNQLVDETMGLEPCPGRPDMVQSEFQGRPCMDRYEASRPDATARSPGRDESRAVSAPGVMPWTMVTFDEAFDACERADKSLCSYTDWVLGCAFGSQAFPYAQDHSPGVCNDSGGPGEVAPTAAFPACVGWSGAYDMSGNVAEWVFDEVEAGLIPLAIGGSYLGGPAEVACGAVGRGPGGLVDPGQRSPEIGFRCCALPPDTLPPLPGGQP